MSKATTSTDESTELTTSIDADTLDTTLGILRTLDSEAILRLGKDGLDVSIVDPGNVAMHHIDVQPGAFDIVPNGEFAIGVNLERLQDAISKAGSGQSVDLGFKPSNRMLNVSYANVNIDLAAIDPDSIRQEPDSADVDLANKFQTMTTELDDAIDILGIINNHEGTVKIECDPDEEEVRLLSESDVDSSVITLDHDDVESASVDKSTVSIYSHDYLEDIVSEIPGGPVTIETDEEYPIRLFYSYAGGSAEVESTLAPRVDTS